MSKRKLLQLVQEGHVAAGTTPACRPSRGCAAAAYTPEAIRALRDLIGVAKANSTVDIGLLEHCVRDDLNHRRRACMAVLRPLKVVLTNYPEGEVETGWTPSYWPDDVPKRGLAQACRSRRAVTSSATTSPSRPEGWYRLAPGREVRLRYAYLVTCDEVVTRTRPARSSSCAAPTTPPPAAASAPDGRKVKGTLHWVGVEHSITAEVRLYEPPLRPPEPGRRRGEELPRAPQPRRPWRPSGRPRRARSLAPPRGAGASSSSARATSSADPVDSRPGALVFNRIIGLKDSWAKISAAEDDSDAENTEAAPIKKASTEPRRQKRTRADERADARAADPALAARMTRYVEAHGLSEGDADVLTGDAVLADFFEAALAAHDAPASVARWMTNEVLREVKERSVSELPFGGAALGRLVALVDANTISNSAGKEVFAAMVEGGGEPQAIVDARGLAQVSDATAIQPAVDAVIAAHPAEAARYRGGEAKLLGFFVGQAMKATGGKANPAQVRALVEQRLAATAP
jgi:glutaminyl-tRNA synthetase